MKIITSKESGLILMYGDNIETLSNEDYYIGNPYNISVPQRISLIHNVVQNNIPKDFNTNKYSFYTEKNGFAINPSYKEPSVYDRVSESDVLIIKDDTVDEIREGVLEHGINK